MAPKVLIVLTSHDKLVDGSPTGWWLSEFAHPYEVLAPHTSITVASPKGGHAPVDQKSVSAAAEDKASQDFLAKHKSLWENTVPLSSLSGKVGDYDAVFFVGGHGPMYDLATDATSQALIQDFHAKNRIIAAVCHGPAAFINVVDADGRNLLEGLKVTGFSDSEERALGAPVPFSLEQRLDQASGGGYVKGDDWAPKIEIGRHGRLITGQNPASAAGVGQAIYDAIFGELTTGDSK